MKSKETKMLLGGVIAGTVLGTALGLFLAPKPGRETRELVGGQAGKVQLKAGGYVERMRNRFRKDQEGEEALEGNPYDYWPQGA